MGVTTKDFFLYDGFEPFEPSTGLCSLFATSARDFELAESVPLNRRTVLRSGRMHIAQGVFKSLNVNKCTKAYPSGTNPSVKEASGPKRVAWGRPAEPSSFGSPIGSPS